MISFAPIREVLQTTPFRAFYLATRDGRSFGIKNPELLTYDEQSHCIYLYGYADMSEVFDLTHVVSVRFVEPGAPERK